MQLIKHAHACVSLVADGRRLVIDPGTFTPDAAEVVAAAEAVLVTHDHFDHVDDAVVQAALAARPDLRVYGPAGLAGRLSARPGQVVAVKDGDRLDVAGFDVAVSGELHGVIHEDVPRVPNVGYLVDGRVYHPGDAYHVPSASVDTLLLPTSGPWTKLGDAVDFVRAVGPNRLVQIHETMLSAVGFSSMSRFLDPAALTDVPLTILELGATIDV